LRASTVKNSKSKTHVFFQLFYLPFAGTGAGAPETLGSPLAMEQLSSSEAILVAEASSQNPRRATNKSTLGELPEG